MTRRFTLERYRDTEWLYDQQREDGCDRVSGGEITRWLRSEDLHPKMKCDCGDPTCRAKIIQCSDDQALVLRLRWF